MCVEKNNRIVNNMIDLPSLQQVLFNEESVLFCHLVQFESMKHHNIHLNRMY